MRALDVSGQRRGKGLCRSCAPTDPPMFVGAEADRGEGRSSVATAWPQEGKARRSRRPWLGLLQLIEDGPLSPEGMRARPSGGGRGWSEGPR